MVYIYLFDIFDRVESGGLWVERVSDTNHLRVNRVDINTT